MTLLLRKRTSAGLSFVFFLAVSAQAEPGPIQPDQPTPMEKLSIHIDETVVSKTLCDQGVCQTSTANANCVRNQGGWVCEIPDKSYQEAGSAHYNNRPCLFSPAGGRATPAEVAQCQAQRKNGLHKFCRDKDCRR